MNSGRTAAHAIDVCMPQLGESVETGTIVRWLKAPGDPVAIDEPLYEVSSDKATMEVPAVAAGYLREIVAAEGMTVAVGAVIARIAADRDRLSPVVRRLLREHGIDAAAIAGSAENGRITKDDVIAFLARSEMARTAEPAQQAPSAASSQSVRRVPLSALRRRAGERLAAAQKRAVDVFSVVEVDLDAVAAERARRKLTYLPFFARAVVDALRAYDVLNATFDEADAALLIYDAVNLGVAVDLDEGGLVVPVLRDAQRLTLDGFAAEIERLAAGARASKLGPDDYGDATFTITNNGVFGTLVTVPAINPPNVAIVSTDAVELRPVIIDRAIAIRHRMYLGMTWDHRAFDGSTAARFLARVKHNLETWDWAAR